MKLDFFSLHDQKTSKNIAELELPMTGGAELLTKQEVDFISKVQTKRSLSNCISAILICCSPYSQFCFDELNCPSNFFKNLPCSKQVLDAAKRAQDKYLNENETFL
jgi:hypothetical protein